MSEPEARPLALVRSADDVLHAAGNAVRSSITSVPDLDGLRIDEATACLDRVVGCVGAELRGDPVADSTDTDAASVLFRMLLEAVGREALQSDRDTWPSAAILEVLRAIDAVRRRLAIGRDTAATSEDLRLRLQSPEAFDLLIEVAHDFRSPLASILFLAETLRDGHSGPLSDHQRSQLGLIYSAAFGLASIASDVMDLARSRQNLVDGEPELYRLDEVFSGVERLVRPVVEEKGLELRFVYPSVRQAMGHPHAVSRVLLNLATNALKFTETGWVEVGAALRPRGRLEYYVQDTGRGIPDARREELFQPFKRRSGDPRGGHFFSGSGVGLSIARRLVHQMGSELEFESSDEEGTRFRFDVPSGNIARG